MKSRAFSLYGCKEERPECFKKVSNIPFKGTKEQEEKLKKVIDDNKHDKSLLMYVMQQAQEIYGYLPYEVQVMIAEGMDVPLENGLRSFDLLRAVFAVAEGRGQYFPFASEPRATLKARRKFSIK